MAAAALVLASGCGGAGGLDNYNKVQDGMSRGEVESLLGKGTEEASNTADVNISDDSGVSLVVTRNGALSSNTTMPEKVAADVKALPEVAAICPGLVSFNPAEELGDEQLLIEGFPAGSYPFGELKPIAGEILSERNSGQRAVIVGKELAKLKSVKVGDTLTITDLTFHVVGIFASASATENGMAMMLLPEIQKLSGHPGQITGCTVKLKNNRAENVDRVAKIIETTIADGHGLQGKLRARPPEHTQAKILMLCWKDGRRVICITFVGGKVAVKASVRAVAATWERDTRLQHRGSPHRIGRPASCAHGRRSAGGLRARTTLDLRLLRLVGGRLWPAGRGSRLYVAVRRPRYVCEFRMTKR